MGGLDYGTVRAAAFMGLRMLSGAAARLKAQGSLCAPAKGRAPAEEPQDPPPLGAHTCLCPQLPHFTNLHRVAELGMPASASTAAIIMLMLKSEDVLCLCAGQMSTRGIGCRWRLPGERGAQRVCAAVRGGAAGHAERVRVQYCVQASLGCCNPGALLVY